METLKQFKTRRLQEEKELQSQLKREKENDIYNVEFSKILYWLDAVASCPDRTREFCDMVLKSCQLDEFKTIYQNFYNYQDLTDIKYNVKLVARDFGHKAQFYWEEIEIE